MWHGLSENFDRVIAADFLGFGLSDKPVSAFFDVKEYLITLLYSMARIFRKYEV